MLNKHFHDFLGLLEKHNVEYVIVGGYAVGIHGFPRYTGGRDVFVDISAENAGRLVEIFDEFGLASLGLKAGDFLQPDTVVEVRREPMKIQVLTGIDGVTFDRCRSDQMMENVSGLQVPFIGFESLMANKAVSPGTKTGSISTSSPVCGNCRSNGKLNARSNSCVHSNVPGAGPAGHPIGRNQTGRAALCSSARFSFGRLTRSAGQHGPA